MTPEQARRLNRLIWADRLRRWGPTAIGLAALLLGMAYLMGEKLARIDTVVEAEVLHGRITDAARMAGRRGGFLVHARLDDGRDVEAISQLAQPPLEGEEAEIRAARHASGRVTYDVLRLLN